MLPDPDVSTGLTQLSYSAVIVWLMQQAKRADWVPFIGNNSATVNRMVALVASGIAAIGVHWTIVGSLHAGQTITITIPDAVTLWSGLVHWFQSFTTTEVLYQGIANRTVVVPVAPPGSIAIVPAPEPRHPILVATKEN